MDPVLLRLMGMRDLRENGLRPPVYTWGCHSIAITHTEAPMLRHSLQSPLPVGVVLALFAAGCGEAGPGEPPVRPELSGPLAAHAPAEGSLPAVLLSHPAYASLDGASKAGNAGSLSLGIDAGAAIPRFPDAFILSVAVFGYAWVDGATGRGMVAVVHPAIGRDSRQNPDGWHSHPVQLTGGTAISEFCVVEIGTSQGGIAIQEDELRLHLSTHWAGLSADALDVAAAFVVQPDVDCAATGLGVHVLDVKTL